MEKRKGALRRDDVPPDIREKLNNGSIESITLAEALVIDHAKLLRAVAPEVGEKAISSMEAVKDGGIKSKISLGGKIFLECFGSKAYEKFAGHNSDTVRAWAAYALSHIPDLSLIDKLKAVRLFADDPNAGVREWAWMALRPLIAANLEQSLELLLPWTNEPSANLRRFAIEITRPRGVWCEHLTQLKLDPEKGRELLEPLKSDPIKYVQDSVANWLNDASKSHPQWVIELCNTWKTMSKSKETERICRRAMRTVSTHAWH